MNKRILYPIILVTNEHIERCQSHRKPFGMPCGASFPPDTETQAGTFREWLLKQFCTAVVLSSQCLMIMLFVKVTGALLRLHYLAPSYVISILSPLFHKMTLSWKKITNQER